MQVQCIPSMVQCLKRAKTYVYCTVLTMVASNINNNRPTINYSRLLTKLKAEVPETTPKKPHIEKTFFPTEAQRRLLNVCGYKDFLNPPGFGTVWEVNQFVTEHADHTKIWKETWWHVMSRYSTLHVTHTMIVFNTHCIMHCILLIYFSISKLYCLLSYTSHYHCSFLSAHPPHVTWNYSYMSSTFDTLILKQLFLLGERK